MPTPARLVAALRNLSGRNTARRDDRERAYPCLARVRERAGLPPLQPEPRLERAAQAHADYLALVRGTGHGEQPGRRGFTGRTPVERARRAGYGHPRVSENIAVSEDDVVAAVESLMGAIYHRFAFLDPGVDQVGLGVAEGRDGAARYVFLMGDGEAALDAFRRDPDPEALFRPPGRYVALRGGRLRVTPQAHERLRGALRRQAPRVVRWPADGEQDVPPAFFREDPHPLPRREVSGYPLSVEFNPAHVGTVRARSFALYRLAGPEDARGTEVKGTRRLSQRTDPNRRFSALQFALFPLERLQWGAWYAAEARFTVDGQEESHRWRFRVREAPANLYTVRGAGETLPLRAGETYTLYVPPTRRHPLAVPFTAIHGRSVRTEAGVIDGNTLRVRLDGPVCDAVTLRLPGRRHVVLRLATADTIAGERPPEVLYAPCGEYAADFRVNGQGETLALQAGRSYRIHVQPRRGARELGEVHWERPRGMHLHVAFAEPSTLRVSVEGRPGDMLTLHLGGGRRIRLRVAATAETGRA